MAKDYLEWPVIGIDLGTTCSSVAVWQRDRVEIIPNELGNRATPSVVGFRDNQRTIGEAAVNQATMNPLNTIFGAKRIIGRRFSDVVIQEDKLVLPFNIRDGASLNKENKLMIVVNSMSGEKIFTPEEICAMTLTKMKHLAEKFLRRQVKNAVVSVPAYFNNYQRQATKDAGTIAGFHNVHIINEPTAAAMAYAFNMKINERNEGKKNVLVFDLGGGTFDVSLVAIENNKIKVISTNGDTHLGGVDFNNKMVVQFVKEFEQKHQIDISMNPKALARLRVASEKAKKAMSLTQQTDIEIDSIIDGYDFISTITRSDFEIWNDDLFSKCMVKVVQCLEDAGILKSDVDDVVLVGGSSRLLKVREMLKNYFGGKEPCASVLPEEVVVIGAALRAAILSGLRGSNLDIVVEDVAPLSLGTDIANRVMSLIIPRNTTIPAKVIHSYQTIDPGQTSYNFNVYEGEEPYGKNNLFVDQYTLSEFSHTLNRASQFNICFDVDMDGILNVTANTIHGLSKQISIVKNSYGSGLTSDEIRSMMEVAEAYNTEDENQRKLTLAKTNLQSYADKFWDRLENDEKIFENDKKMKKANNQWNKSESDERKMKMAIKIRKDITDTLKWLEDNMNLSDISMFETKLRQLQTAYSNYNGTRPIARQMRDQAQTY